MKTITTITTKKKMDSLQAVRAFAFLGVYLTHCEVVPNMGGWGVSVFILLSGFLMTVSYFDRIDHMRISWRDNFYFAVKKIKRLYPLHLTMDFFFILMTFVGVFFGATSLSATKLLLKCVLHATLTQTFVPIKEYYYSLNGLSWYLSVSLFLYFAFPWILSGIKKNSNQKCIWNSFLAWLIIAVFVACSELYFADNDNLFVYLNYVCPVLRLFDFFIGCNFGILFIRNKGRLTETRANVLEGITILLIVLQIWFLNSEHTTIVTRILGHSTFLYAPTSIALVYLFAESKGIFSKLLTNRLTIYLGDISPYGYLIHVQVILYLNYFFQYFCGINVNKYLTAVIVTIVTFVAIQMYLWIEKKLAKGR